MNKVVSAAAIAAASTAVLATAAFAQSVGNQSTFQSFNKVDGQRIAQAATLEYHLERGNPERNIQCILKANVTNNTDQTMYVRVLNGNVRLRAPENGTEQRRRVRTNSAIAIGEGQTRQVIRINPNLSTGQTPCTAQGHMNFRVSFDEAEANRGGFDRSQRKGIRIR